MEPKQNQSLENQTPTNGISPEPLQVTPTNAKITNYSSQNPPDLVQNSPASPSPTVNSTYQPTQTQPATSPIPAVSNGSQTTYPDNNADLVLGSSEGIDAIKSTKRGIKKAIIAVLVVIIIGGGGFLALSFFVFKSVTDYSKLTKYTDNDGYSILVPEKWQKLTPENEEFDLVFADSLAGQSLDESMAAVQVGFDESYADLIKAEYSKINVEQKKTALNVMWSAAEEAIKSNDEEIITESIDHNFIKHQGTNESAILATIKGKLKKDELIKITGKILMTIDSKTGIIYLVEVEAYDEIWENEKNQQAFERIINEFTILEE